MSYIEFLIRIVVCFVLGASIGLERQIRRKLVGLRTNTLVAIGAFLFVVISSLVSDGDTTRIAAQVVSGIGFLGAGVILRDGVNVKGLNTAATLWCSAAIGTLCAFGLLIHAAIGTAFIIFSNVALRYLSKFVATKQRVMDKYHYSIKITCGEEKELIVKSLIMQKINKHNVLIYKLETKKENDLVMLEVEVELNYRDTYKIEKIVNSLYVDPDIIGVVWGSVDKSNDNQLDDDIDS